jgi:hypothetical protein
MASERMFPALASAYSMPRIETQSSPFRQDRQEALPIFRWVWPAGAPNLVPLAFA